ncbi:hypothetical protein GGF32_006288 [Allomyces javanicus]|nr:hypothetical protein GGF32_006288 [Allomyces javanicus]
MHECKLLNNLIKVQVVQSDGSSFVVCCTSGDLVPFTRRGVLKELYYILLRHVYDAAYQFDFANERWVPCGSTHSVVDGVDVLAHAIKHMESANASLREVERDTSERHTIMVDEHAQAREIEVVGGTSKPMRMDMIRAGDIETDASTRTAEIDLETTAGTTAIDMETTTWMTKPDSETTADQGECDLETTTYSAECDPKTMAHVGGLDATTAGYTTEIDVKMVGYMSKLDSTTTVYTAKLDTTTTVDMAKFDMMTTVYAAEPILQTMADMTEPDSKTMAC